MNTRPPKITDEQFKTLCNDDKYLVQFAYPVGHCDKYGKHEYYRTCGSFPDMEVSEEQILVAKDLFQKRKEETLAGIRPGELVLRAMGGSAVQHIPGEVGNYRARGYFLNSEGRKFFIEFILGRDMHSFWTDCVKDCVLEEEFHRQEREVAEWNREHRNCNEWKKYPEQFYHLPIGKKGIQKEFTWENVLEFVNDNFGCTYTSKRLIEHFASCEEWTSTCHI